ncbi:hypothetical protein RHGRI_027508 [Rhododendron griersonianum]|uniref:DUF674 family protein n=1 Tax=Rhododendron griersonianum TaxID=479676 RepID=A0AAV6IXP7_9ERIC|nr:hypothetical protein RHGRI_027508 [Rhododendron griersonianum]
MATRSQAKVITLKLLIDTESKNVLFAEAGKDFVDFLFNLLHLPVGTVVRLLTEQTTVGTLGNLYQSIQNLSETYFQSNQSKYSVLKPKAPLSATQVSLLRLDGGTSASKTYYTCPTNSSCYSSNMYGNGYQFHEYILDNARAVCPSCSKILSKEIEYVAAANEVAAAEEGG